MIGFQVIGLNSKGTIKMQNIWDHMENKQNILPHLKKRFKHQEGYNYLYIFTYYLYILIFIKKLLSKYYIIYIHIT